ncbi:hypothetical protein TNCT_632131 [Trichonephila clavata]|uniref:Uncharacterized protein n=1 Tax=Trichonephila clavata TaxID=2740835 RepID=A0A8X6H2T6_TRICU|nr:hypothetical protein TNCT_632131 [Trichonephila clavata]
MRRIGARHQWKTADQQSEQEFNWKTGVLRNGPKFNWKTGICGETDPEYNWKTEIRETDRVQLEKPLMGERDR